MKQTQCISPDTKAAIRVLTQAGYQPKAIKQILDEAGLSVSMRYVYILARRIK